MSKKIERIYQKAKRLNKLGLLSDETLATLATLLEKSKKDKDD